MCRQLGDEDECPASGQSSLRYLRLCRLCAVVSTSEEPMEAVCMAFLSSEYGWLVGCDATAFRRVEHVGLWEVCETNVQGGRVQREWCCCMVSLGVAARAQAMCVGMFPCSPQSGREEKKALAERHFERHLPGEAGGGCHRSGLMKNKRQARMNLVLETWYWFR